tara:strand:+ start:753 stop:953 length:201 start_codon:yes stop_codon:yes gene_type:complete
MNAADLKIGDLVDLTIKREPENTYIVGEVQGIRQDYFKPDQIAILVGGIDIWLSLTDTIEVRLADV